MANCSNNPAPPQPHAAFWTCALRVISVPSATKVKTAEPNLPAIHPDPVEFASRQLGLIPDPKQAWILRGRHQRLLVNCSRQWGKSTTAAAAVLHRMLTQPNRTFIVLCPVLRQSAIFVNIVRRFVAQLGIKVRGDGQNSASVLLPNGSSLVGLPGRSGDRIRGFSGIAMLIIDEAARLDDSVFFSAYPMVTASGADIWALTTPLGKKGFFYNSWIHGGNTWERVSAPATECPRIPAEALERARLDMGNDWVRQEYLCEFVDIDGSVFSRDAIDASFNSGITVLGGPDGES